MCEQCGMTTAPATSALAKAADISMSYASEIVNGKRTPKRALAIRIYRATGWRPANIAQLSEADIDMLERIEAEAA